MANEPDGMTWEAPTPTGRGYDWEAVATVLRANPNQWLKVFDDGPLSVVNAIRQEQVTALRPRQAGNFAGFDVRTRNNRVTDDGRVCSLYLRWVPAIEEEG